MKTRIIGTVLMLLVLGAVGYVTGAFETAPANTEQPQQQFSDPGDADFKNLKIN